MLKRCKVVAEEHQELKRAAQYAIQTADSQGTGPGKHISYRVVWVSRSGSFLACLYLSALARIEMQRKQLGELRNRVCDRTAALLKNIFVPAKVAGAT